MCSVTFVLRPSRKGRDFAGRLFIRLIRNRRASTVTTPYQVFHNEWDARRHCLIYSGCDPVRRRELSLIEEGIQRDLRCLESIISHQEKEGYCSASGVGEAYRRSTDKKSLSAFTARLCQDLQQQGRERTARAYNTISYYMRNLRAIYNKAIDEGLIENGKSNPFSQVYTGVRSTRKRALSKPSLLRLAELDVLADICPQRAPKEYGQRGELLDAQRLFFFSFHARGISFVDLAYLRKDNIRHGVLSYYRKKTGRQIEVKVSPAMQSIINSFSERVRQSPYLFPIIRNSGKKTRLQYESGLRLQNKRLKKLANLAGVKEKVTTHVARHSWATMAKRENLPLWVISEGLGHSNEKTTYTYLASFERSILDQAGERISTLVQGRRGCYLQ